MKKLLSTAIALSAMILISSCSGKTTADDKSWAWTDFERAAENPVLSPDSSVRFLCPMRGDSVAWMESDVFNPAAVAVGDKVVVIYRSEDNSATGIGKRTSRLGYAESTDGVNFSYDSTPVLYPDNDSQSANEQPGGCEDPRIAMTDDGLYVMMYTQWNRNVARLAVATSRDLKTWVKHGPAFAKAYDGRFADNFSKSASIVTRIDGDRQVIAKIDGKYWMYWGEAFVNVATSDDLINWIPILDDSGELLRVMTPRDGKFDSVLTGWPPAIFTEKGILLFYNGKNGSGDNRDKSYAADTYCGGQALFDATDPTRLISRLDEPFFVPEADFEKSGQYPAGTVFIEGMAYHGGKWYLYYGCADSRVGVAVYEPSRSEKKR